MLLLLLLYRIAKGKAEFLLPYLFVISQNRILSIPYCTIFFLPFLQLPLRHHKRHSVLS